jgi:hypothetical protein
MSLTRAASITSLFRNKDDEKKTEEPSFLSDKEKNKEIVEIIQANMDKIPDESLIKLTRQIEFWQSPEHNLSTDDLVNLTKRLVHAATWRYRLNNDDEKDGAATESSAAMVVPKVRYGRTELQMPIVTCGGMRLQQTWMPDSVPLLAPSRSRVLAGDSQKNLKDVIECCIKVGLNHFETARMYGTSELQFIDALVGLMEEGVIKREDFIFQTKVMPAATRKDFEKTFKLTWDTVKKLGYIDLFAFHVVSKDDQVEWVLNEDPDGIYAFIKDYQSQGKIKHIGFSTHGTAENIMKLIESNKFSFVNIHSHYFGSYHAEGTPDSKGGHGNRACVKRALELDMGVFQISPFDKGGLLYRPSAAVAKAVGPELTPISFAALHSWKSLGMHTVSVGFARASDLDEVLEAVCLYKQEETDTLLQQAESNLEKLAVDKLGKDWYEKGMLNIPSCYRKSTTGVAIGHILWLHNVCTAFGLYEFARERYSNLDTAKWNDKKSFEDNITAMEAGNSGRAFQPNVDLTEALKDHYDAELVKSKLSEAHEWCSKGNPVLSHAERKEKGWDEAYSLSVWDDFPGIPASISVSKVLVQCLSGGHFGINNKKGRRNSLEKAQSLRESLRNLNVD